MYERRYGVLFEFPEKRQTQTRVVFATRPLIKV